MASQAVGLRKALVGDCGVADGVEVVEEHDAEARQTRLPAVLAEVAKDVYSIEIVDPLARIAAITLRKLGYESIHLRIGEGYRGWPEAAPFDAILVRPRGRDGRSSPASPTRWCGRSATAQRRVSRQRAV